MYGITRKLTGSANPVRHIAHLEMLYAGSSSKEEAASLACSPSVFGIVADKRHATLLETQMAPGEGSETSRSSRATADPVFACCRRKPHSSSPVFPCSTHRPQGVRRTRGRLEAPFPVRRPAAAACPVSISQHCCWEQQTLLMLRCEHAFNRWGTTFALLCPGKEVVVIPD
uniref:Uncharacterized protein n=1 Tax=Toxoplasma gondii (strain ATCC 50861 / VEG) TaxID=432359 RepID=A0A0F7UY38_TOXGV|nr:TPA: hypothetical protein BN1205_020230 [Toxoplasma gondii VEG]